MDVQALGFGLMVSLGCIVFVGLCGFLMDLFRRR